MSNFAAKPKKPHLPNLTRTWFINGGDDKNLEAAILQIIHNTITKVMGSSGRVTQTDVGLAIREAGYSYSNLADLCTLAEKAGFKLEQIGRSMWIVA